MDTGRNEKGWLAKTVQGTTEEKEQHNSTGQFGMKQGEMAESHSSLTRCKHYKM